MEYVLFPALAAFQRGIGIPAGLGGTGQPLPANLTLTRAEVEIANRLTDGYNAYLGSRPRTMPPRITLVDVNKLLTDLKAGWIPGVRASTRSWTRSGSAFSLDGIHPNYQGIHTRWPTCSSRPSTPRWGRTTRWWNRLK